MIKVVLIVFTAFLSLYAECECKKKISYANNSIGVIFSSGEGSGLLYRLNFEDSYLQAAGYIYFEKNREKRDVRSNYALSYAKYLFENKKATQHFKALIGFEGNYEEYGNSGSLNIKQDTSATVGAGFEWGKRERGSIMFGLDALYFLDYSSKSEYSLYPTLAIYTHYNF